MFRDIRLDWGKGGRRGDGGCEEAGGGNLVEHLAVVGGVTDAPRGFSMAAGGGAVRKLLHPFGPNSMP